MSSNKTQKWSSSTSLTKILTRIQRTLSFSSKKSQQSFKPNTKKIQPIEPIIKVSSLFSRFIYLIYPHYSRMLTLFHKVLLSFVDKRINPRAKCFIYKISNKKFIIRQWFIEICTFEITSKKKAATTTTMMTKKIFHVIHFDRIYPYSMLATKICMNSINQSLNKLIASTMFFIRLKSMNVINCFWLILFKINYYFFLVLFTNKLFFCFISISSLNEK